LIIEKFTRYYHDLLLCADCRHIIDERKKSISIFTKFIASYRYTLRYAAIETIFVYQ
jgi:hypothetical protein